MPSDNVAAMPEVASQPQQAEAGLRQSCHDMTALCRSHIGAALASSQAAICGVPAITSTLLAFLQSRAKDGLAASQRLAACDSPEARVEVQLEYLKAMVQAYSDECGRLQALTGRILAEVLAPVPSRAGAESGTLASTKAATLAA